MYNEVFYTLNNNLVTLGDNISKLGAAIVALLIAILITLIVIAVRCKRPVQVEEKVEEKEVEYEPTPREYGGED